MNNKLEKIAEKYKAIDYNEDNYSVGGGLDGSKFASNRHEDAKFDEGKLTEGQAAQLFKKATGLELDYVKSILNYAVPNMEWHHAGKLPKQYGGGMKKTYFLNSKEIADIAANWDAYCEKLDISNENERTEAQRKQEQEAVKQDFLNKHAERKIRVETKGIFFYETNREMNGKYGWFSSYGKSYSMTEYFSGWEFKSEELYQEFLKL